LAEDKVAGNGEPSRNGISEHCQDEKSHAINRLAGILLKLVKRADCGRDTLVTICIIGSGRILFEAPEIEGHREGPKNNPSYGKISAGAFLKDVWRE
jgi:hypothetical protein